MIAPRLTNKQRVALAAVVAVAAVLLLLGLLARGGFGPTPNPTLTPTPPAHPTALSTGVVPPLPTVDLRPVTPNPLVKTLQDKLTAALRPVVDGRYCTPAWTGTSFPATISLPVQPVSGDLLLEWNSSGTSDYISMPGAPTYGLPKAYKIATSADSTNGADGTWREVVSVEDNKARTRAHRFASQGARWVRMTVTASEKGPLGDLFAIDEIDLHDASNGTADSVFFLGDSITAMTFSRCPTKQPSFAALVSQSFSGYFPAMIDGGVGGVNSGFGVQIVGDWLALNPDFHIWAIGYGTNDAWQKVHSDTFEQNLQTIVDHVLSAGRVPVLARIPYAVKGPEDTDITALNTVIDKVAAENGLLPGPDLYAWFKAHPDELQADGVHPTDAGSRSINRLWYEALRPLYGGR